MDQSIINQVTQRPVQVEIGKGIIEDGREWITHEQARAVLQVGVPMFEYWLRSDAIHSGRWIKNPVKRGKLRVFLRDEIEALRARVEETKNWKPPEGYMTREEVAEKLGYAAGTFKTWVLDGKVPAGEIIKHPRHNKIAVYKIEDFEKIKEMALALDPNRPHRDPENPGEYVLPDGMIRRQEACRMFGVRIPKWERWEREGVITCGEIISINKGGRLKIYPIDEIKKILEKNGFWSPPYPDPERPGVYRVPLSGRGIERKEAIIDEIDLPLVLKGSCSFGNAGKKLKEVFVGYSKPDGTHMPLRRAIMSLNDRWLQVGHKNGDALDCRRENLVIRNVEQRSRTSCKMTKKKGPPCTSKYKGVFFEKSTKRWRARIHVNDAVHWLGRFRDEIAAAKAYDDKARVLFGEHAWLNFPDGPEELGRHESAEPGKIEIFTREEEKRAA